MRPGAGTSAQLTPDEFVAGLPRYKGPAITEALIEEAIAEEVSGTLGAEESVAMEIRVVDTNVLVRYLARAIASNGVAARIFSQGEVRLLSTVLLETEWVLRKVLKLDKATCLDMLRRLPLLSTVVIAEPERFQRALELCERGLDFADAFHLASVRSGWTFVTFDRALRERRRKLRIQSASSWRTKHKGRKQT